MNIVILRTNSSDFGKVGSYNVQEIGLANALRKKGHNVSVLYLNRKTKKIVVDEKYSFVYYLPHISLGLHGIFNVNILSVFCPEKIILFSDNQLWAKNVILWSNRKNIECIQYFGAVLSNTPFWLNQLYTKLILLRNRKSYKLSINVAKTTEVQAEMERLNVSCERVINIGLDVDLLEAERNLDIHIRDELGLSRDDVALLFVGRLSDYKRPLAVCDVLRTMLDKHPNTVLVLIGQGEMEEELNRRIIELGLEKNIIRKKNVPYNEMYKYMVACDCCINMSHVEIFGMTILESMYYGLPIVAHTAPGPNEIIEDGVSGYLCASDDPAMWVELIEKAINNRENVSIAAHESIVRNFIWDNIAERFLELGE